MRTMRVMSQVSRVGRPRASSCEMLEEAAGELFLEQGYARTSIADITQRAGVSRNTFFNYFNTKADLLWFAFDDTFGCLHDTLIAAHTGSATVREAAIAALRNLAGELPPENVALAYAHAEPMGLIDELRQAAALRTANVGATVAAFAASRGVAPMRAEVAGLAYAGALIAAIGAWSRAGAGNNSLPVLLDEALAPIAGALP